MVCCAEEGAVEGEDLALEACLAGGCHFCSGGGRKREVVMGGSVGRLWGGDGK